jgi:two-component system, LytTR family, sensor kinase
VLAPLIAQDKRIGTLIMFYRSVGRPSHHELRVVQEAASLVSAQVELSLVAEQEERLAQAELRALRAQISPHFIYNSLTAIASFVRTDPARARDLLLEFADFTRYSFRRGGSMTTVAEELRCIDCYFELEQARFGDQLELAVRVAPEILSVEIPFLCLQPLVENAVRHGLRGRGGQGTVTITAECRKGAAGMDEHYAIVIHDDGVGMDEQTRAAAVDGSSTEAHALSNITERLRAAFGTDYGLELASSPETGTSVTVRIPR